VSGDSGGRSRHFEIIPKVYLVASTSDAWGSKSRIGADATRAAPVPARAPQGCFFDHDGDGALPIVR